MPALEDMPEAYIVCISVARGVTFVRIHQWVTQQNT